MNGAAESAPESAAAPPRSAWAWVPSLYFVEGVPYVIVMTLSVIMYKRLGVSNTDIALWTSWLYLPWVLKPLWSPLAEMFGTKRRWIVALQFLIGLGLALVALALPGPQWFALSLALFWLMAFASATHDIAADGFYLLALGTHEQAAFVGVRSTFYRLANIGMQGGLVFLAGRLEQGHERHLAWALVLGLAAAVFGVLAAWHGLVLPRPAADRPAPRRAFLPEFATVFAAYFRKPGIVVALAYLLLYRFPEAQLLKLATPFLLDPAAQGGLGLATEQVGLAYGTVGLSALTLGGLLGGLVIARWGLRRTLWPLAFVMHVPNLVFLLLAWAQPTSLAVISGALALEQFGYGLGFTAYMMFMILVAESGGGAYKTAHYAICTGFMALGMMLPGMWSGWLQQQLGYAHFFAWVLVSTLPSLAVTALLKIPADFGRK